MENVIVTGAGGQVGRQLVSRGTQRGLDVTGFTSAEFDVTDPAAARRYVTSGAVVINCAGYTAVDAAESDEAAAFAVNEAGPRTLAAVCSEVGARLIHLSTDYVFAGDASTPYEPTDPTAPATVYGRSKLAGERAVLAVLPTAQIVRTAWVYTGSANTSDRFGKPVADFVTTMRRLERERDTVDVVTDQVGSPTYAGHLAEGLLDLAQQPSESTASGAGVLHLTNGGRASWFDLARAVFASAGADANRVRPCTSAQFVRPAPRPAYSVLSPRAWTEAGLSPLPDWTVGLRDAVVDGGWADVSDSEQT